MKIAARLPITVLLILTVLVVAGHALSNSFQRAHPVAAVSNLASAPATEHSRTATAVSALIHQDKPGFFAALDPQLLQQLTYQPQLQGDRIVNPHGACSSPVPLPSSFDIPCKSHDLGYDLLRTAQRSGHPLGPWARKNLDARLAIDMRASCSDPLCRLAADVAAAAVSANSWVERSGPPQDASTRDYLGAVTQRVVEAI